MRTHGIAFAALQLLALASAQESQVFKNTPRANLAVDNVYRRQSPPPGYHPEFGACGSGTNCENACGPNWISCQASTDLSLFCYNEVDLKQTCCENGSGRACEEGYYCAWQEFGGKVWCCENGQSLEECGLLQTGTSTTGSPTSSGGPGPSSSTSDSPTSREPSGTATGSETLSPTNSQCPASTVTSWATTTVLSTVSIATATVTVTEPGGVCSSSISTSPSGPSRSTSVTGTITTPPLSSSTFTRPPITNTTTTSTIVTAGAGDLAVNPLLLVGILLPVTLLWL